jgi:uncharacterized membrane protein YkoI
MKVKTKSLMIPVIGLTLLFGAGASSADENPQQVARLVRIGEILSFAAILSKVQQVQSGSVVTEADLDGKAGVYVYEVEIVTRRGIEWDVDFDAQTGAVLRQRRDD